MVYRVLLTILLSTSTLFALDNINNWEYSSDDEEIDLIDDEEIHSDDEEIHSDEEIDATSTPSPTEDELKKEIENISALEDTNEAIERIGIIASISTLSMGNAIELVRQMAKIAEERVLNENHLASIFNNQLLIFISEGLEQKNKDLREECLSFLTHFLKEGPNLDLFIHSTVNTPKLLQRISINCTLYKMPSVQKLALTIESKLFKEDLDFMESAVKPVLSIISKLIKDPNIQDKNDLRILCLKILDGALQCVPAKMEENIQYLLDLNIEEQKLNVIPFICNFLESENKEVLLQAISFLVRISSSPNEDHIAFLTDLNVHEKVASLLGRFNDEIEGVCLDEKIVICQDLLLLLSNFASNSDETRKILLEAEIPSTPIPLIDQVFNLATCDTPCVMVEASSVIVNMLDTKDTDLLMLMLNQEDQEEPFNLLSVLIEIIIKDSGDSMATTNALTSIEFLLKNDAIKAQVAKHLLKKLGFAKFLYNLAQNSPNSPKGLILKVSQLLYESTLPHVPDHL